MAESVKPEAQETIVAVATPLGVGGLGVVRLSGAGAVAIADALFRPSGRTPLAGAESHRLVHGWLRALPRGPEPGTDATAPRGTHAASGATGGESSATATARASGR